MMSLAEASRMVSFGLVVLIWLVQIIIYPSFAEVAPDRFRAHHAAYTRAISWFVIPLMFGQVFLIGRGLVDRPDRWGILAAALVVAAWVSIFVLSVPLHGKLQEAGYDADLIRRLVATNWPRTVAWTLAFLALLMK
ncbi:hypothetical protein TA3x_004787 [Tundrisphaera sp. TA3]|uniref:hypothetical protein n=1 Tax=Tundrisphaera sp. TA3 TaxID=3435775 RepID=UPI003EBFA236